MSFKLSNIEPWAADIVNKPGMLARVLEALRNAGAQLEFIIARRVNENTGRVFVAPLRTSREKKAAADVGLVPASGMRVLRIEGPDRPGVGADIARAIADKGINLRSISAASLNKRFALYLAFGNDPERAQAAVVVRKLLSEKPSRAARARTIPKTKSKKRRR